MAWKLFGVKTVMKNLILNSIWCFCFFFNLAFSATCDELKDKILKSNGTDKKALTELKSKESDPNLCYKNVLGIMLHEGIVFEKDIEKAGEIFTDLTKQGYKEAQYNLGLALAKRNDVHPERIIQFLLGNYVTFLNEEKDNKMLAKKTRQYLMSYVYDDLPIKHQECVKSNDCNEFFSNITQDKLEEVQKKTEFSINYLGGSYSVKKYSEVQAENKKADAIVAILTLGVSIYNISQAKKSAPNTSQNVSQTTSNTSDNLKWQPLPYMNPRTGLYEDLWIKVPWGII